MPINQQQIDGTGSTGGSATVGVGGGGPYGPGLSPQPGFSYRNVWKPLTISFIGKHDIVILCNYMVHFYSQFNHAIHIF